MVGAVSGINSYFNVYGAYAPLQRASQMSGTEAAQSAQRGQAASVWTARRGAAPDTPVQAVRPVRPVDGQERQPVRLGPALREGADPAEMAVRMRIKPYEESAAQGGGKSEDGNTSDGELKVGAGAAQAAVEEGKCQTCEERKYQDGSDDMGVSFQTPTHIAPEQVASAVRGHENEHVVREQAKAQREDRRVVSQSVTLHTAICPECGKAYISGGTTRTVTAAAQEPQQRAEDQNRRDQEQKGLDLYV